MTNRIIATLFSVAWTLSANAQLSSLDPTFGNSGVVLKSITSYDVSKNMVVQNDGKILVVGRSQRDGLITRFLPNGQNDNNFGSNGSAIVPYPHSYQDYITLQDVIPFADRIITCGYSHYIVNDTSLLVAFTVNGVIDSSFGVNGIKRFKFSGNYTLEGLSRMIRINSNEFIATGMAINPSTGNIDVVVARFDIDGNLVTSFGDNGYSYVDHENLDNYGNSIVSDSSGNIYVCGSTNTDISGTHCNSFIVKLHSNGIVDSSFGVNGRLVQDVMPLMGSPVNYFDVWTSCTIHNNKLIVAGYTGDYGQNDIIMERLELNGTIDPSFGNNGLFQSTLCPPYSYGDNFITNIAVLPDNRIIAAGTFNCGSNSNFRMFLSRLSLDGHTDSTFGTDGYIKIPGLQNYDEKTSGMVLNADGSVYQSAVSLRDTGFDYDIAVIKYKSSAVTTGVSEINTPLEKNVYPTAVSAGEAITIEFVSPLNEVTTIILVDVSGKRVVEQDVDKYSLDAKLHTPTGITSGMYFLKIVSPSNNQTEKIIVR